MSYKLYHEKTLTEENIIDAKLLDTLHEDETFKKTYAEERKNFLKEFPTNERNHINYFMKITELHSTGIFFKKSP